MFFIGGTPQPQCSFEVLAAEAYHDDKAGPNENLLLWRTASATPPRQINQRRKPMRILVT